MKSALKILTKMFFGGTPAQVSLSHSNVCPTLTMRPTLDVCPTLEMWPTLGIQSYTVCLSH